MAKLKDIKGSAIQYLAEDPIEYVGTWASSTSINTARGFGNGAGTTNANLYYGGSASPTYYNNTESWNGTAWTEVNDLNTARGSAGGMGTSTSAVCAGGRISVPDDTAASETWDGTSWSEGNDLNSERYSIANRGAGTQTAGLCAGGRNKGPGSYDALTEEYNGTSWTEVNDLPAGVESGSGLGTQTAAGLWGGYTGSYRATGLLYDGTNWTSTTDFPFPSGSASEAGSTTAGLLFGIFNNSAPGYVANTFSWDGTTFTEENDLSTARGVGGGPKANLNTSSSALMVAGTTGPSGSAATEEWSFPPSTSTILQEGQLWFNYTSSALKGYGTAAGIPAGVWSSGGSVNNAREGGCWFGSLTAGVAAGGDSPGLYVEHYDGSSWTSQSNIPTRAVRGGGTGPQTAGLIYGMGHAPSGGSRADGFKYDGSTWTEISDLNTARTNGGSAGGAQTSALYAGGTPPIKSEVEIWDGTSWTEVGDLNDSRYSLVGGGTTTSAVMAGGYGGSPTTNPAQSETWDGSSWTESSELNTGRAFLTGGGSDSTQVILFGGGPFSPTTNKTEFWNGSSWTELNDMASISETSFGTTQGAGVGTYRASGRIAGTIQANTEEWTVDNTLSTVTVS